LETTSNEESAIVAPKTWQGWWDGIPTASVAAGAIVVADAPLDGIVVAALAG